MGKVSAQESSKKLSEHQVFLTACVEANVVEMYDQFVEIHNWSSYANNFSIRSQLRKHSKTFWSTISQRVEFLKKCTFTYYQFPSLYYGLDTRQDLLNINIILSSNVPVISGFKWVLYKSYKNLLRHKIYQNLSFPRPLPNYFLYYFFSDQWPVKIFIYFYFQLGIMKKAGQLTWQEKFLQKLL